MQTDLAQSQDYLKHVVEKLSSWPNRNSNLPTHREAADWLASELSQLGVKVDAYEYPLTPGPRVFAETATQLVGTIPGTRWPDEEVWISAHFDTINWTDREGDPYGIKRPSPGANDDASGVACVMNAARQMIAQPPLRTVRFALFSGEEQGLLGAKWLAARALEQAWSIVAILNNDMVANVTDDQGVTENQRVRVLSPEGRSRDLARWMQYEMPDYVKLIFRHDRFGRGGDHTPFNQAGFCAVRLTEVCENYARQHTDQDTLENMDLGYLQRVAELNFETLVRLANAGTPPTNFRVDPTQGYGARITWDGDDATWLYWRDTTSPVWEGRTAVNGNEIVVPQPHKDDAIFAVSSGGIPVEAS